MIKRTRHLYFNAGVYKLFSYLALYLSFAIWLTLTVATSAKAQTIDPILQLRSGIESRNLSENIRYTYLEEAYIDNEFLLETLNNLRPLRSESIHFGPPDKPILVRLDLHNTGSESAAWILTTGRGALSSIQILSLNPLDSQNQITVLFDSNVPNAIRENLSEYQAFSSEIFLQANEQRTIVIIFETINSTYLPLKLETYGTFFKDRRQNIALVAGVVIGAMVLIILNVMFFTITGIKEFMWLGAAQLAYTLNTLHAEGYTGIFLFPGEPSLSVAFEAIVKCTFAILMAQFARSFIKTHESFPKLDIILRSIIYTGAFIIIMKMGFQFWPHSVNKTLFYGSWLVAAASALLLPFVGIIATHKLGRQYAPLILAWGSLGFYIAYAAIASLGIFPNLPINWHLAGPIGLFEGLMATLALGLHIRKIQLEKVQTNRELTQSLQARLEISEQVQTLSEQRAAAIATIADQNSLLHASGHDSRQVVSALNCAVAFIESKEKPSNNEQLSALLKSSITYLDDIASTTMSTSMTHLEDTKFIVISAFQLSKIFHPLEMIYNNICRQKSLMLEIDFNTELYLITDRALLMRALSNVMANAVKFTENGKIKLSAKLDAQYLVFTITDTGRGINGDLANRLSRGERPREKGDEAQLGTGSGFYSAYCIMKQLGGDISIKQSTQGGTLVTLRIQDCLRKVTPCTLSSLQKQAADFEWFDADKTSTETRTDPIFKIAVSYDDRIEKRSQVSLKARLMFLKPLFLEMGQHSLLSLPPTKEASKLEASLI